MTLILVRDYTSFPYLRQVTPQLSIIRLLVHPALLALTLSMSY
jgi:hypothetical protein